MEGGGGGGGGGEDNARGGGVEGEPCGEKKKREDRSLGS